MPKTQKTPSYRKHRASGQAVVSIDGKDHYLGVHGTAVSKKRYDAVIAEWLAGGRNLISNNQITVTELISAYWKHAKGYYQKDGQPTEELNGIKSAMRPLQKMYGRIRVGEFGPLKLKAVREGLIKAKLSRTHINKQIGRIRRCFKWGVENEYVDPSTLHALEAVAGLRKGRSKAKETKPVKPVLDCDVDAIQEFVSPQVWAMVELQRLTGMRSGEVVIMRRADIDVSSGVWLYRPLQHKSEHHDFERLIDLGPKAQAIIKPFLKPDLDVFLFDPRDARTELHKDATTRRRVNQKPSPRKSSRNVGDHYSRDSYRRNIYRACEKAGIDQWHPHRLRHLAATNIRKAHGIEMARIILGHQSMAVTEIYAEVDREKASAIVAEIG